MADAKLARQLPVARQIVISATLIAFAILLASFGIVASVQSLTGGMMVLAIEGAVLLGVAAMILGSSLFTMRMINKMETAAPKEGLPALEHALSQWVDGERAALNDLELDDADELAELELRAAWALRTTNLLGELRDQRRAMPVATSVDAQKASLKQLQARIAAAAEVNRTR